MIRIRVFVVHRWCPADKFKLHLDPATSSGLENCSSRSSRQIAFIRSRYLVQSSSHYTEETNMLVCHYILIGRCLDNVNEGHCIHPLVPTNRLTISASLQFVGSFIQSVIRFSLSVEYGNLMIEFRICRRFTPFPQIGRTTTRQIIIC